MSNIQTILLIPITLFSIFYQAMSKADIFKYFCYDMFTLAIYGCRTISILLPKEHGMDMAPSVRDSVKVCVCVCACVRARVCVCRGGHYMTKKS